MSKTKIKTGMVGSKNAGDLVADIVIILLLCGVMFVCIVPLWHCLMSSFSTGNELIAHEGVAWLPIGWNTGGYELLLQDSAILTGYANTLLYVVGNVFFGLIINVLGGFALSRETKLKPVLMLFVVFTMMFSGGTIPTYIVMLKLGLVGSRLALILPNCTNAIFVILITNAFKSVPAATVEAAELDGAGHLTTMFKVMLPQCAGMLVVVIINTVVMTWNAWFDAMIYVPYDRGLWPLQLWIKDTVNSNRSFLQSYNPDWNKYLIEYCVIVIGTVPILATFPFFQKILQKGMIQGAVKE